MPHALHSCFFVLLVILSAACSTAERPSAAPSTTTRAPRPVLIGEDPNSDPAVQHVQHLLHAEQLLRLPAVRARTDSFVAAYRSGKMSIQDAAVQFGQWLDAYKAAHSAEVAALTARPVPPPAK